MATEKRCSKCGEVKSLSAFGKDKKAKDGIHWSCKACNVARARAWVKANPDKRAIQDKRRRLKNYDRVRDIERRSASRPEAREQQRQYRQRSQIVVRRREWAAAWRETNREWLRLYGLSYYHGIVRTEEYLAKMAIAEAVRVPISAIPDELAAVKAAQLRVARICRDLKKERMHEDNR